MTAETTRGDFMADNSGAIQGSIAEACRLNRETFLKERLTIIGGSDAASLFSVGYGCRRRLVYQKRGIAPDHPQNETAPMRRGNRLEHIAAEEYAIATGRQVKESPLRRREDFPFLGVHIDRWIYDPEKGWGVLEIKCVGREMFYKIKREGMLDDYVLQLQHGMLVTGASWGAFCIFWADGLALLHWDLERDEVICQSILEAGVETWDLIQGSEWPGRLALPDKRCSKCEYRTQCQGALLLELAGEPTGDVPEDWSLDGVAAEYLEAKQMVSEAEEILESRRKDLEAAIGQRTEVSCNGALVYWRPQETKRLNGNALKATYKALRAWALSLIAANPDVWQKLHRFEHEFQDENSFNTVSVSRPLRVYPR